VTIPTKLSQLVLEFCTDSINASADNRKLVLHKNLSYFLDYLSEQVNAMGPLIDQELEKVDRKHAQLTQLSSDLVEALNLYHTLMREPAAPQAYHTMPKQVNYGYPPPPSAHVSVMYVSGMSWGTFLSKEHHSW
jgi:hypothetical protein